MMQREGLEQAKKFAAEVRRDLCGSGRLIDLDHLLAEMGVELRAEPLPGDIEGITAGDRIVVDPSQSIARRRFTIAHELGHYLMSHGEVSCGSAAIHGAPTDRKEVEANTFAAGLLMPTGTFRADARRVSLSLDQLEGLASTYGVSVTAAAIRYVECAKDACAVVGLRSARSPWLVKSWGEGGWFVRLPPSSDTLVHSAARSVTAEDVVGDVLAEAWLDGRRLASCEKLREEVRQTSGASWLVLLSEIPDFDEDPQRIDAIVDRELERRRNSFRQY